MDSEAYAAHASSFMQRDPDGYRALYGGPGSSRVELCLSASGLVNLDWFSKSDPLCVVYLGDARGTFRELGRTEMIRDDLNPHFVRTFLVNYCFHEVQPLRFLLYDIDNKASGGGGGGCRAEPTHRRWRAGGRARALNADTRDSFHSCPKMALHEQDLIGEVDILLSDVVGAPGQAVTKELRYRRPQLVKRRRGYLTITAEECSGAEGSGDALSFEPRARQLRGKGSGGGVILTLLRTMATAGAAGGRSERAQPVYRSEVVKNGGSKGWRRVEIPTERLCRGDEHRPILFEAHAHRSNGQHILLGTATTTLAKLMVANGGNVELALLGGGGRPQGALVLANPGIYRSNTFLQFIRGGCEVCLSVAVDFTASNRSPADPRSLHFWDPNRPNEYVRAIESVGSVLMAYDSDRLIPLYGFGAKVPPNYSAVSHCFPLTFSREVEVDDIKRILEAYRAALPRVVLAGPTYFSRVIAQAAKAASRHSTQGAQQYHILLILTDGNVDIQDMAETKRQIIAASELPLSIIILGVGGANFDSMRLLDSDDVILEQDGKEAKRDIVQFVSYREFAGRPMAELAAATLEEVPRQFLSYMREREIQPNPPLQAATAAVDVGEGKIINLPRLVLSAEQRRDEAERRKADRARRRPDKQLSKPLPPPLPSAAWADDALDSDGRCCFCFGMRPRRRQQPASYAPPPVGTGDSDSSADDEAHIPEARAPREPPRRRPSPPKLAKPPAPHSEDCSDGSDFGGADSTDSDAGPEQGQRGARLTRSSTDTHHRQQARRGRRRSWQENMAAQGHSSGESRESSLHGEEEHESQRHQPQRAPPPGGHGNGRSRYGRGFDNIRQLERSTSTREPPRRSYEGPHRSHHSSAALQRPPLHPGGNSTRGAPRRQRRASGGGSDDSARGRGRRRS